MKINCSLLIYNKAIGYIFCKCYKYLCDEKKLIYIVLNLIEQCNHYSIQIAAILNTFQLFRYYC